MNKRFGESYLKILFIGMPDSVHAARWIDMVSDQGWKLYFFPVYSEFPHYYFKNITILDGLLLRRPKYLDKTVRLLGIWPLLTGSKTIAWIMNNINKRYPFRNKFLYYAIKIIKPDIIHSLEFQKAGYYTLYAKKRSKSTFPKWIATNYGSDIFLFGRLSDHKEKIIAILENCDYYDCECQRDVHLAKELGLKGKILPVIPNGGGFDLDTIKRLQQQIPPSKRQLIVLKGYQGWAGRALVGLHAIELLVQHLSSYRVAIINTSEDVKIAAELLSKKTGIPIEVIPKISREEILKIYGNARIYIGLSIGDAISTSLLEAMVMGAFPIQSNTSCAEEWIQNDKCGFIVPPEDPEIIAKKILIAIKDDILVDQAGLINQDIIRRKLDQKIVKEKVTQIYRDIFFKSYME